jgi:hypothetical protein
MERKSEAQGRFELVSIWISPNPPPIEPCQDVVAARRGKSNDPAAVTRPRDRGIDGYLGINFKCVLKILKIKRTISSGREIIEAASKGLQNTCSQFRQPSYPRPYPALSGSPSAPGALSFARCRTGRLARRARNRVNQALSERRWTGRAVRLGMSTSGDRDYERAIRAASQRSQFESTFPAAGSEPPEGRAVPDGRGNDKPGSVWNLIRRSPRAR